MSALPTLRLKQGAPDLLVLLPGAYMKAADFVTAGFFAAVEQRRLALDLAAVDLDLAAISAGTALPALRDGILAPARAAYRRVWLGGISLGGLLALATAADHPATIDGLCLLAPYPGSRLTANAIARAGGLDAWQATPAQLADPEFRIWHWLKSPPIGLPAFVGHGRDDRFAAGMLAIGERFPAACRQLVDGGHEWPAWYDLWEYFLTRGHFAPLALT